MKFAKATKFHRKSGQGLGINPEDDLSAVGAALTAKGTPASNCGANPFLVHSPLVDA
jgi:hypothetical protein